MAGKTVVYGLFGPTGLLGVYDSAEHARMAGDFWIEARALRTAEPWRTVADSPGTWQRALHSADLRRPEARQSKVSANLRSVLRVCPIPVNGKPGEGW